MKQADSRSSGVRMFYLSKRFVFEIKLFTRSEFEGDDDFTIPLLKEVLLLKISFAIIVSVPMAK